jgi:hypothetical protein
MNEAEFQEARKICGKQINRETVELHLAQLYELMEWPKFDYIVYLNNPSGFSNRCISDRRWSWSANRWIYTNDKLKKLVKKLIRRSDVTIPDFWDVIASDNSLPLFRFPLEPDSEFGKTWISLGKEVVEFQPRTKVPVILEKPIYAKVNADNRFHCEDGPAILWASGDRSYWWNGVRVSQRFIEKEPTISYINRQFNQERKRVLIERYGEQEYLKAMKAKLEAEDEFGKLWRIKRGRVWWTTTGRETEEDIVMVEVVNSSAEPDGSFRKFFLRVPPSTKTPKAAVAWTFKQKSYTPKVQT